jgi:hypothetical protein
MAVTKITVSTAMRARDVSRPSAEHLTEAAAREEGASRQPEAPAAAPSPAPAAPAAPAAPPASPPPSPADQAQPPSRRRRRRGR